jgi:CRP-like cAMP-binding protein
VLFSRKHGVFAQGATADAVFYVQTGKVKLTLVSKTGEEATVGILGEGDFFDRAQLVDCAAALYAATVGAATVRGCAVQIALLVQDYPAARTPSVLAALYRSGFP